MTYRVEFASFLRRLYKKFGEERITGVIIRQEENIFAKIPEISIDRIFVNDRAVSIHYKYLTGSDRGPHHWTISERYAFVKVTPFRSIDGNLVILLGYYDGED